MIVGVSGRTAAEWYAPKYANVQRRAATEGTMERFRVAADQSISPADAGAAYHQLVTAGRPTSPPERPVPRQFDATALPAPRIPTAERPEGVPLDSVVDQLFQWAVSPTGFTPAQQGALRELGAHPLMEPFSILARAPGLDPVGGRFALPFPDTAWIWALPIPSFRPVRDLARTRLGVAALLLSEGESGPRGDRAA